MRDPVTLAIVAAEAPDLHGRVLATLHAALPRVGVLDPGAFACDLAGTEELLGTPSRVARMVLTRCARAGAHVSAGIGPTPFVARVVAERTPAGELRSVDDGRAFLAPLPLDVLPVDEKVHEELRLLGLRTVGEFADLPRGSVFDRFGECVAAVSVSGPAYRLPMRCLPDVGEQCASAADEVSRQLGCRSAA